MQKAYNRIKWENYPSDKTPLNETNLNRVDAAVDELDNRVITQDTTKADKTEVATLVQDVAFEESTGIFTITKKNGAVLKIDTKLEKIAVNFSYDRTTEQIILTLIDGTKQYIDLSALITQFELLDSATIGFEITADGRVKATVLDGSITEDKLQPNYLADIKVETAKAQESASAAEKSAANAATSETNAAGSAGTASAKANTASASASDAAASATKAESYAVGGTGTRTGEDADNAKYYSRQASASADSAAASADTAAEKATNAASSAASASSSASSANTSKTNAANSATSAERSAASAATSATQAGNYANGSTDSAKYYYEQAKNISESFSGALRPMGTVTFASLPDVSTAVAGEMYNISDQFTTTADFKEGAGNVVPAGTNVYRTADGYWDILAGTPVTGVKGAAESTYHRGNVDITLPSMGVSATAAELNCMSGVTGNVQTQLDNKASLGGNVYFVGINLSAYNATPHIYSENDNIYFRYTDKYSGEMQYTNITDIVRSFANYLPLMGESTVDGRIVVNCNVLPGSEAYHGGAFESRCTNPAGGYRAGYGFHNSGLNAAYLYYDESGWLRLVDNLENTYTIPRTVQIDIIDWSADGYPHIRLTNGLWYRIATHGDIANFAPNPMMLTNVQADASLYTDATSYNYLVYNYGNGNFAGVIGDWNGGINLRTGLSADDNHVYRFCGGILTIDGNQVMTTATTIPVANGGTGQTTIPSTLQSYFPTNIVNEAYSIPLLGAGWDNNGYIAISQFKSMLGNGTFSAENIVATADTESRIGQYTIHGNTIQNMTTGAHLMACDDSYAVYTHGAYLGVCKTDGSWTYVAASAFSNQSSRRYKENIEDMTDEEALKVLQLRPVKYDYIRRENGTDCYGVIAEEVDEIMHYPVIYDSEGEPDGVDYSRFVPYLIKTVQIQQQEIDALKKELAEIKSAVNNLSF